MLVYLCPLSLSAQFVSVRSLPLYVPLIYLLLSSAFYLACGQTRDDDPILGQCWPTIYDDEPTLAQYWVTVSCLMPR